MAAGGYVMPPLLLVTVVLWYALGARWVILRRGSKKNVRVLLRRYAEGRAKAPDGIVDQAIVQGLRLARSGRAPLRRYLDDAFAEYHGDIKRYARTITVMVAIAPLLGLLGTVAGMIETFNSLGDMSLFSQSGGIAGGIATALFTTQMGLVVAVPGVICKSLLDRRQHKIEVDLAQIKDLLIAGPHSAQES
ncbi:MotA/TolQ/ExbB proton channel family protein [Pseudoxanthomonas sp. CAU 1598]|uniref:MotA/TolQ/ExbB proton channel family protein n=2 Tax=Pseudomarimonas arenosa TaxID=2774145 RepID=A0AAW3ZMR8_9GAMM|nr:MotA/TolQ/ExbB proton channel family protein [Pseudomarimonas arenosa]